MRSRATVAVLAGMAVAGSVLIAPSVAADPAATGRVATWGHNSWGQLGNNSTSDSPVPVDTVGVLAGKTVTSISAGTWHTCALADGKAYCWGYNYYGQLGNNSTTPSSLVPVVVDTTGALKGKTVTGISAGYTHTCALADGKAYCWGENAEGQLGDNGATSISRVPVAVNTTGALKDKTVTAINADFGYTCALADGKAYCWGWNGSGQLGNNSTTSLSLVPVAVNTTGALKDKTVTAISAGGSQTCAVADGEAYCWGANGSGQLGNNSTASLSRVPVAVDTSGPLAARTVTGISAGGGHTCAVAEGRASCWGANDYGQLGDNSTTSLSRVPVAVDTSGPLAARTVTGISAGYNHTCAVADGYAYCWGRNEHGQLGNNNTTSLSPVPVTVDTTGVLTGKKVTAISAGGDHTVVLAASVPAAPTSVSGVPADRHVSVFWAPPGDDGGSPVLDYTATSVPGGASCTTSGTSCTVTGLVNGTGYTFTVTARNAIGTSVPSAPSAPVTPQVGAPGAVTGVKVKLNKKRTRVKISWRPVGQADSYRIRISKPGGKKYRAWQTIAKRKFKAKVRPGRKYRVQIAAVGPGGTGPRTTIRFTTR